MTLEDYIFGLMTVRIKGLNLMRFLNTTAVQFGAVRDIKRISNSEIEFCMKKKSCEKLLSQIDKVCYNIEVVRIRGLGYRLSRILSRAGLLAGFFISVILISMFNSFVWILSIDAPDPSIESAVQEILKENNIHAGVPLGGIDTQKLRLEIETGIDSVVSANVQVIGVSLKVSINEIVSKLPVITEGDGLDIVAKYDCRVDAISVITGTPTVKKGSIVKAGAVIVRGVKLDEKGEKPVEVTVRAEAEVYGTVWFTASKVLTETILETERTGRVISETIVYLTGFNVGNKQKKITFSEYEIDEKTFYATQNNLIPLKVTKRNYYETKKVERTLDIDAEREKIQAETLSMALNKVYDDCTQKNTYFFESDYEGIRRIEAVVETYAKVSIRA